MLTWLVAGLASLGTDLARPPKSFASGEAIVAFRADGEPGRLVAALATGDECARPGIDEYLASLSKALDIPVTMRRLGSGGEVLLVVDFPELGARLAAKLEGLSAVGSATPVVRATPDRVTVESTAELKAGSAPGTRLSGQIAAELEWPVSVQAPSKGALLVRVDLDELTLLLVERLRQRSEVAYAQPNFKVQKAPRGP